MSHIIDLLFDRSFIITVIVGVMAFATVVTLGMPAICTSIGMVM